VGWLNRTTPRIRDIARTLILFEGQRGQGGASEFPATDRMRPQLMRLMGNGGVHALLSRALVLATLEAPWISNAAVNSDGDLGGLHDIGAEIDPEVFLEGRVILLAQLLGLLVTFIGPTLTWGLVHEIWPHIAPEDRDFGREQ